MSFLGQPKTDMSQDYQLQFNCPRCAEENGGIPDGKYNLEVNIGRGVYHCWRCESSGDAMSGSLRTLIKRYGGKELLSEYEAIVTQIRINKLYKLPNYEDVRVDIGRTALTLPPTFQKINLNKCDKRVKAYLDSRKITQDIIDKYNIGYTSYIKDKPSWGNRIIIPSYNEDGTLAFWTGRDFTNNDKRVKYCNSPGIKKNDIVYVRSTLNLDCDVYIAEGALDAIMGPPNCTALLGKVLKKDDALYKELYSHANANIIIVLDGDTQPEETKRIYRLLNHGRLRGKIRYVNMQSYKDFGEAHANGGHQAIINIIKEQKVFSEIELLM